MTKGVEEKVQVASAVLLKPFCPVLPADDSRGTISTVIIPTAPRLLRRTIQTSNRTKTITPPTAPNKAPTIMPVLEEDAVGKETMTDDVLNNDPVANVDAMIVEGTHATTEVAARPGEYAPTGHGLH